MGSCFSSASRSSSPTSNPSDSAALGRAKEIDRSIKLAERQMKREIKILLLGAGESGKSTILKQTRYIYGNSYSADELDHYRHLLFENLIDGLHQLFDRMVEMSLRCSPTNEIHLKRVSDTPSSGGLPPGDALLVSIEALWTDPAVVATWAQANKAALPSNLEYLVQNASRFWASGFAPTDSDILASRATTMGISESTFAVKDMMYKIVDVGGQRSERRKWVNVFSDVNAILFVVSLSGYDECLLEDRDANQMRESMVVFSQLVGNPLFKKTCIVIALNKNDLFEQRLKTTPLGSVFGDFRGPPDDAQAARLYFRGKFLSLARKRDESNIPGADPEGVYVHVTTAVDRRGMEVVMRAVSDVITRNTLRDLALL